MLYRWRRRPKIVALLGTPGAQPIRDELKLAAQLGKAPTILRGRQRSTTYLFDDPEDPSKVTGTVDSPEYTSADWALSLGYSLWEQQYDAGMSPCGAPIEEAWNSDSDGCWRKYEYKCYRCTAASDDDEPVYHERIVLELPPGKELKPFIMDETVERR